MVISLSTQWGRWTQIYVSKLNIIGSDNGLSPDRLQTIIVTNAGILLIQNSATNFSEILSKVHTFSFKKMHLKMTSAKWWPFYLDVRRCFARSRRPFQLKCLYSVHRGLARCQHNHQHVSIIRFASDNGCGCYDLTGIPPVVREVDIITSTKSEVKLLIHSVPLKFGIEKVI